MKNSAPEPGKPGFPKKPYRGPGPWEPPEPSLSARDCGPAPAPQRACSGRHSIRSLPHGSSRKTSRKLGSRPPRHSPAGLWDRRWGARTETARYLLNQCFLLTTSGYVFATAQRAAARSWGLHGLLEGREDRPWGRGLGFRSLLCPMLAPLRPHFFIYKMGALGIFVQCYARGPIIILKGLVTGFPHTAWLEPSLVFTPTDMARSSHVLNGRDKGLSSEDEQ